MEYAITDTSSNEVEQITQDEIKYFPKEWREHFWENIKQYDGANIDHSKLTVGLFQESLQLFDLGDIEETTTFPIDYFKELGLNDPGFKIKPLITFRSFSIPHMWSLINQFVKTMNIKIIKVDEKSWDPRTKKYKQWIVVDQI